MKTLFKKKRHQVSDEMSLNITSMADIFTIILVFLLKSFATGAINIVPAPGSILPEAQAAGEPVEALKLEITPTAVLVDDKAVLTLVNYRMIDKDLGSDGASKAISQALATLKKRQLLIAQVNTDVKVDSKILVVADQKTPYITLKQVLASAATQGYTDYKLAVIRKE